ncbi:Hint domain-containing protein [Sulfitobacter sp. F26169L]|uniref:Hint domain-containing protein n=1 Tax=Sulfitobacter sp. F26169L TaxID=2996015 RepID=UPI002260D547|nr:Hint domain-containing protein [Sulfitobacter sp. F26169L]MCX7565306.1 Hint domain-containing protein [Sulfitobacter sp. F26169L]
MNVQPDTIAPRNRVVIRRDRDAPQNAVVQFLDGRGALMDEVAICDAADASPCFTTGTMIATPRGEVAIENLGIGDRVITRDNGLQYVRWIGQRTMTRRDFLTNIHLAPVRIRQGALGNDVPERDMMVSPNHRMLVANDKTALHFEDSEVLVAAKHLTGLVGVDVVQDVDTTYLHLMFDNHEVILSDGAWSESFQPDVRALAGIGNAQRLELLTLFPQLATQEGLGRYTAARRIVTPQESEII